MLDMILKLPLPSDEKIAMHKLLIDGVLYAQDAQGCAFYVVYGPTAGRLHSAAKAAAFKADDMKVYYFTPSMVGILIHELAHTLCFLDYSVEERTRLFILAQKKHPRYFEERHIKLLDFLWK